MTRARALIVTLSLLALLAAQVANAAAACDSWTNAAGGSWATPGNWSAGLPTTTSDVCITLAGTYSVTLTPFAGQGGAAVASLTLGASTGTQTLVVSGQSFVDTGNSTDHQTSLTMPGAATIGAHGVLLLDATGGGGTNSGVMGGSTLLSAGSLANSGLLSTQVEDVGQHDELDVSTIANQAGGSISVASGTLTFSESNPFSWTATNAGSVAVAAAGSLNLATSFAGGAAFTNDGTVANAGSITMGTSSGSATWTQSGGSLSGNPVVLARGTTLADSAGTGAFVLELSPGLTGTIPAGQTVTVEGQVNASSGTTVSLENATLVNDGTLVLDAAGTTEPVYVVSGAIQNNGSIVAQDVDPTWPIHLEAALANAHSGTFTLATGSLIQEAATTNDGIVTLAPGVDYLLREGASFVNASDGTVSPQIASASSVGHFELASPCCAGPGAFTAGGTLSPALVGGFVPTASQEFQAFVLSGTFSGTFAAVTNGFSADYTHATASPAYVGVVYGTVPPASPGGPAPVTTISHPAAHVGAVAGGKGKLSVKLSCPAGAASCATASVKAALFEHLKGTRIISLSALAGKKQAHVVTRRVVVASASVSLSPGTSKTSTPAVNAAGRALLRRFARLPSVVTVSGGGKTLKTAHVSIQRAAKPKG
ncbi:MAG TPA: hypothetical protein VGF46_02615 [Gaiellales bacterium]